MLSLFNYMRNELRNNLSRGRQQMTIGQRIRERRKEQGLTLKQLAEKTDLTVTYLSDVERDRTRPSLKTLGRVAEGLGIGTTDLMAGADDLGDKTDEALPVGLREAREDETWGKHIDDDWVRTLQRLDYRGRRPQSKEDWLEVFINLRRVLKP